MYKKLIVLITLLLASTNLHAFNLIGTWKLVSIEKNVNNRWEPDCNSPNGLLIYTKNGYMAAGINCMLSANSNQPSFAEKDITFYMGTYSVKGDTVTHHPSNANSATYLGKDLLRKIQIISDKKINLVVKNKMGQSIRLEWEKIG